MRGIYLCSCKARHRNYDIVYNDVLQKYYPDILKDCLDIDLSVYDFVIATPPCNFWSRANYRYKTSEYALATKHLLPDLIVKLACLDVPFLIENVINKKRMRDFGIYDLIARYGLYVQYVGRHIYISNRLVNLSCEQHYDFRYGGYRVNHDGYREGGSNVYKVIEIFLRYVHEGI